MKLNFDTLKCAKIFLNSGFDLEYASELVKAVNEIDVANIYSKEEVDIMLSETVEKVFRDHRAEVDRWFEAENRRHAADIAEIRAQTRWLIGTIITSTFALAGYMSALFHFTH